MLRVYDRVLASRSTPKLVALTALVGALYLFLAVLDTLRGHNSWLKERGIRFYAGAPLQSASGPAIGSVCVFDTEPRKISDRDKAFLEFVPTRSWKRSCGGR